MEKLIVIAVVILGSIIHSWIQRKQEEAEEQKTPRPPRPARGPERRPPTPPPVPEPSPRQWQDELRRLLQGETPGGQTSSESSPAPGSYPGRRTPAAPPPMLARSSIPVPDEGMEMEVGLPVAPVTLSQASSAHDRAQIGSAVVERMRATGARVMTHSSTAAVRPAASVNPGVRRLFQTRQAQRDAILASIVLGPPKSLENASR